jgi:hypothetical protein
MRRHTHIAGILTVLMTAMAVAPAASAASGQALLDDAPGADDANLDTTQCLAVYPFCGGDPVDYFVGQAVDLVQDTVDDALGQLP